MSSNSHSNALTKEQLIACLEYDGLELPVETINKAKSNDGEALKDIGYEYRSKKQDYSKAMAWYRLAANQNNTNAYNYIGYLHHNGLGVSQDYLTAMEYYLKAARDNQYFAMGNISLLFLNGNGVPVNKYKALEWLAKSRVQPEQVKELNKQGIHLIEEDKNKTIHQLINETKDIQREERMKRESELKTRESKSSEEIQKLGNELQKQVALLEQEKQKSGSSTQLIRNLEQQLADKVETMNVYQTLMQSKNNEINLLKKDNQRYENIEKENMELKHKLDEYERRSQPLTDNTNDTNNTTTSSTANNTIHNETVDNIRVKIETDPENYRSLPCQIGTKKRKVSSTDS